VNKSDSNSVIVGVKAKTYPEERNFSGLSVPGFNYKKVRDFYKYPAYAYFKLNNKPHPKWLNLFNDFGLGNYEILHFFNAISSGKKPWITTFEYYVPRGAHKVGADKKEQSYIDYALTRIARSSCKQLIALSQFAYDAQLKYLKDYGKFELEIEKKMRVMHPPQQVVIKSITDKPNNEVLSFVLIGADFFRKGGMEVLRVFDKLLSAGAKIELTIVSKMLFGDYASQSTANDLMNAKTIIAKYENIKQFDYLENNSVLDLMKSADVALLPSYEETYGYTVLEAQANGCPVITTNGTAFPEINNNDIGWLIEVELDEDKRSVPRSVAGKKAFTTAVELGLEEIIQEILSEPSITKMKGAKAIHKIREKHCPVKAANELAKLYKSCLNND
jgi:glycosyltransferase involved in cell wall biosynthesis